MSSSVWPYHASGAQLRATLSSSHRRAQPLLVDYVVHYVRKAKASGGKTFKWTTVKLGAGEEAQLTKTHGMKPTTIRALYPGKHRVQLMVGGEVLAETTFELRPKR